MKKNRIKDSMLQKYREKDIKTLILIRDLCPVYAQKASCYIDRIKRKEVLK